MIAPVKETKQLFFIALLPPEDVTKIARQIQKHCAEVYQSRAALKSPPHITLQAPFKLELSQLPLLEQLLANFAQNNGAIPMILDGFAAFKPRVIYINVLKNTELLTIYRELSNFLEISLNIIDQASKNHPFAPHLTVAFRDLKKSAFHQAWQEFEQKSLHFEFVIPQLTLLKHNGKYWEIYKQFSFKDTQSFPIPQA